MKGGKRVPELEELYSGIKDKLYGYIMKLSGNGHIAEEIVQETFCRALEQILISKRELNTADKSLLKFQGFDNSVGNKAKYIIDNGLKIYGLRVTGPSTELIKLDNKLEIRMEEIMDLDFYYWK